MLELYWTSGSPFAWRVMLALELKHLAYTSRLLQMSRGETQSPAFRALNPRGKVPVLVDGDVVVRESLAILAYLDRKHPVPAPLFGRDPVEAAVVMRIVSEVESYLTPEVEAFMLPLYFGEADAQADVIRAAAPKIHAELAVHEATLADGRPWLAGDAISAADLLLFPAWMSVQRAAGKPAAAAFELPFLPVADRLPRLAGWQTRVESTPQYDRTYPPHWRA